MNTTINIKHIKLLLKRYFIESKQLEITFWGIITLIFMLIHETGFVEMIVYIAGLIFASRTYKILNHRPNGMHYLLLPANQLEKVASNIILSTFYFFGMILITYTIGTLLGIHLGNYIFEKNSPIDLQLFEPTYNRMDLVNFGPQLNLWNSFITFALIQSVFMLGSIYFNKNVKSKTILFIISLGIILTTINSSLSKLGFETSSFTEILIFLQAAFSGNSDFVSQALKYLIIPTLWYISYFKLTKTQV